jgi:hypothetical protein
MRRIKTMRCICCSLLGREQQSTTDAHHIRANGQARNDWLTIPLCHDDCHQGAQGVHGDRTWLRMLKMSEWDLLAATIERMPHSD